MITFCYFKPPLVRDTLLAEIEVPLKEIASKMHIKIFTSEIKKNICQTLYECLNPSIRNLKCVCIILPSTRTAPDQQ